jgi:hypothetical protein
VARFYSNENIALQVVMELRRLGHDVVTSREAGKANAAIPDPEVLAFAAAEDRILLSHNRVTFCNSTGAGLSAMPESYFAPLTPTFPGKRVESARALLLWLNWLTDWSA